MSFARWAALSMRAAVPIRRTGFVLTAGVATATFALHTNPASTASSWGGGGGGGDGGSGSSSGESSPPNGGGRNYIALLADLDDAASNSASAEPASLALAYASATDLVLAHPEDPRCLWRAARAAYNLGGAAATPAPRKKELLNQAYRWLQDAKATPAGRASNDVYRWSGTVLESLGAFDSTAQYIKNAFLVRDDWEQAVAIDPSDASAHHLLGRWCLSVADMPGWKRTIASSLFAEPPRVRAVYKERTFTRERRGGGSTHSQLPLLC